MKLKEYIDRFKKPGEREQSQLGWFFHFRRYLSFYLSIPFTWTNLSPNQITGISQITQLAGLLLIACLPELWPLLGLALFYLGDLLDYVDGNIARFRQQTSKIGVFYDQLGHVVIAPLFYFAICFNCFFYSGNSLYLYAGIIVLFFRLLASFQIVAIVQYVPQANSAKADQLDSLSNSGSTALKVGRWLIAGFLHYKSEILLVAIIFKCLPLLSLLATIYFPARFVIQLYLDRRLICQSEHQQ